MSDDFESFIGWDPDRALQAIIDEKMLEPELDAETRTRRVLKESAVIAARSIGYLSTHSSNERIRLEASKYIVDQVIGKAGLAGSEESDLIASFVRDVTEAVAKS